MTVHTNTTEINTAIYVLVWPYSLKQYVLYINMKTKYASLYKSILKDNVNRQSACLKYKKIIQ